MKMADGKGTDIRLQPFKIYAPRVWPRMGLNTKFWCWKVIQNYPYKEQQHINVLELRSLLNYSRFRAKRLHKHDSRALLILDSQVVVSVASKGRSSSIKLNGLLTRLAAVCVACNFRFIYGWCSSEANPADRPSRIRWPQN